MFAYCGNNPIVFSDDAGTFSVLDIIHKIKVTVARAIVAGAPSLLNYDENELSSLDCFSYNCAGNGLGKQIDFWFVPDYTEGMTTRQAYGIIQEIVGKDNIRELESINDIIDETEFRGAFRCGPSDLHFIRQLSNGQWYNKSGTAPGLVIPVEVVTNGIDDTGLWYALWMEDGRAYFSPEVYYDDETIYYALKKDWWK